MRAPAPEPFRAPAAEPLRATAAAPDLRRQAEQLQQNLPGPFRTIPVELVGVCGLMALAGVLTLWPVVRALNPTLSLLGNSFTYPFGLLILDVLLILGFFGAACLILSWRLANRDRVARGLSFVLLGGLGAALLFGDMHDTQLVLVMLACFGSLAILGFSPGVQRFFDAAAVGAEPTSLVIARVLVAVWAGCMIAIGVLFLPLHELGTKYVVVGLLLLGLAVAAFVLNRRLSTGDLTARALVSAGAAVYAALLLIVGRRDPGLLLPLSLAVGVLWFLWVPEDVKAHFAES